MMILRALLLTLSLLAVAGSAQAAEDLLTLKTRLQASMQAHIDTQAIDGALLHLDMDSGEVAPLYPAAAHPMILRMGDDFVLCAQLRDKQGAEVPVDFYVRRDGERFRFYRTEIANRAPLERLMERGRVKPLE